MSSTKVFFYGLFMDPDLLRNQGLNPQTPVKAKLTDYKLVLANRATMVPSPGSAAWGMVMSLTDEEIAHLYAAPSVTDYHSLSTVCISEHGEKINAVTYILPDDYPLPPPKDANYAKSLRDICIEMDLPRSYIKFLNELITDIES